MRQLLNFMERTIALLMHCPLMYSVTSECELTSTSPSFIFKSLTHFNKKIYNFTYTHAFTLSTCIHFNIKNIPLFYLKENFILHSQTIQRMQTLFNAPHMHACKSWITHASSFNSPTENKIYILHAPNHSIKKLTICTTHQLWTKSMH